MLIELNKRHVIVRPTKSHKREEYVYIRINAIIFGAKLPSKVTKLLPFKLPSKFTFQNYPPKLPSNSLVFEQISVSK